MKTRSAGLQAAQSLGTTTLAWCWKVTRLDGQVFGFTSVDIDLVVDGITYAAATGFTPTAIEGAASLSVGNLEVSGFLDSAAITEADLLAGLWDGATVEIFEVDHTDLSLGTMVLRTGTFGAVSAGRTAFTAELRGLGQALQQPVGEVYAAACPATLGDVRCGVDLDALAVNGTVTAVASRRAFTDTSLVQASDYFGAGVVEWLTGDNAGQRMEVRDFAASVVTLSLPMPYNIAVGDTFEARPGCRKRFTEDCIGKYSNGDRFRGFPHVPLNDLAIGEAGTP